MSWNKNVEKIFFSGQIFVIASNHGKYIKNIVFILFISMKNVQFTFTITTFHKNKYNIVPIELNNN